MIELIFVIVVLGILAAVAVPRLAATRDDAHISRARSDIASIRSAIITERQSRLFRGQTQFITQLDTAALNTGGQVLFDGNGTSTLLPYGLTSGNGNGEWIKTAQGNPISTYVFRMNNGTNNATFDYNRSNGIFDCRPDVPPVNMCAALTR